MKPSRKPTTDELHIAAVHIVGSSHRVKAGVRLYRLRCLICRERWQAPFGPDGFLKDTYYLCPMGCNK